MRTARYFPSLASALLLLTTVATSGAASRDEIAGICRKHGIIGGLIVQIGRGEGPTIEELRLSQSFQVHGLRSEPDSVRTDRVRLQELGVYGGVSVDTFDGRTLPYADNMVNVIVAPWQTYDVSREEMLRVLVPGGVVLLKDQVLVKRWPEEIDQWTHFLHDASGNAVSTDRRVAPPRHLQWDGGPRWSRSHETDMSITAVVTAGGRIFHTLDEGPIGLHETPLPARRFPDKCSLVARDAFNGIVLWKRPMPDWGSAAWDDSRWQWGTGDQLWSAPLTLPRRLVAVGDRLYVTLGFRACVSELDARTGKTLREFEATQPAEEIVLADGLLVVRVQGGDQGDSIVTIELESGQTLWKKQIGTMADLTLAVADGRVCFSNTKELVALDLRTGDELWKTAFTPAAKKPVTAATLVMHDDVVLCTVPKAVGAYSASDGKLLWRKPVGNSFRGMPDVFVIDGKAWLGTLTTAAVDLKTGEESTQIDVGALYTGGHHVRCYRGKATCEYLLWSKRGVEFVDLDGQQHARSDWVRGTCRYGILPANGLLYAPPHPCFCFPGVKVNGFLALSARDAAMKREGRWGPCLEKGPVYDQFANQSLQPPASGLPPSSDWSTYRSDNARSGHYAGQIGTELRQAWRTDLRGKVSPPVVADGRLYVAEIDTHRIVCLDAADGKLLWNYTAGGPVDSPPTICQGRVLFGCTDGSVYCLAADDGQLVWRFRAAPYHKRIMSYGRLESAWPVHGSVLVEDGIVYFAAGRSSFLDGGIDLYGLAVATGEVRHHNHLVGPEPDLSVPNNRAHEMDGAKNDILVSNGEKLFLTQNVFDLSLEQLPAAIIAKHGARQTDRHLVATGGFLDDSGFDRLFWMYAERWPGLYVAPTAPKAGQILVFDDDTTYGLHTFNRKFSRSPYFNPGGDGYDLFADDNHNEPLLDDRNARAERGSMTRAEPAKWTVQIPVRARAMVLARDTLFLAGPPDLVDPQDPLGALEGRKGARLWAVSTADGRQLGEYQLDAPPVFDGLIAAGGKLYITTTDGAVRCWK